MRFTTLTFAAFSLTLGLGLGATGCREDRADSAYHPSPAAWYGYNPSPVDGKHTAKSPNTVPLVPGIATDDLMPGTTRATANVGGTGGGPSNGGTLMGEHRGHSGTASGTADNGALAVSRTGKK